MPVVRGLDFPGELLYFVERHVWVREEGGGIITVGLTALGSALAGDILAFTPKRPGTTVERDRAIGVIEISKVASSVRSPANGVIQAANPDLETRPGLVNRDPYGAGWLVRIEASRWNEDKALLTGGAALASAIEEAMTLEGYQPAGERK